MQPITVNILTYAPELHQINGNLLALRTARTGFPNAEIVVMDNNSCPEARVIFRKLCLEHEYIYIQMDLEGMQHHTALLATLKTSTGQLAIIDPDVIFWNNCEGFFDRCSPGKLTVHGMLQHGDNVRHRRERSLTWVSPRLHTSFLCISDAQQYLELINKTQLHPSMSNPWQPVDILGMHGICHIWHDTGAYIYEKLKPYHIPFTIEDMDCYDHIYNGTHEKPFGGANSSVHEYIALGDYEAVKGSTKQWFNLPVKQPYWKFNHLPFFNEVFNCNPDDPTSMIRLYEKMIEHGYTTNEILANF